MSTNQMERLERENVLLHNEISRLTDEVNRLNSEQQSSDVSISVNPDVVKAFERMTTRQHAAMQGILHCMSNEQISDAMGSNITRVKVYVHALSRRLGVSRRDEIIVKVWDTYRCISADRYLGMARIPKEWILKEDKKIEDLGDPNA